MSQSRLSQNRSDLPSSNRPEEFQARTTRSKKIYSPWDIFRVNASNPQFDLDTLLQEKIHEENANLDEPSEDHVELEEASHPEALENDGDEVELEEAIHPKVLDNDDIPPVDTFSDDDLFDTSSTSEPEPGPPSSSRLPAPPSHLPAKPIAPKPQTRHKKRRNKASHIAQAKKRACSEFQPIKARPSVLSRFVKPGPTVKCNVALNGEKVTSTGFVGRRDTDGSWTTQNLEYFVGKDSKLKFTFQEWDGEKPMALLDKNNRVIGILAGHPNNNNWPDLHRDAAEALENQRLCTQQTAKPCRRGAFVSFRSGVSHGGGQTAPGNLHNDAWVEEMIQDLNNMECFKRISSFSSSVMATRMPKLYQYYLKKMGKLYEHDKTLKPPFPHCIHSAVSYNCGPRTVCFKHCDCGNLAFGMCSVTALGDFDYKKGGHLVLWPLRLVIEFPPGTTILIPSSIIAHSNTTIGAHERRYSFTQYTSGALFRWVDNNFQKATTYRASLSAKELKRVQKMDANRWKFGLSLLPIVEDKAE